MKASIGWRGGMLVAVGLLLIGLGACGGPAVTGGDQASHVGEEPAAASRAAATPTRLSILPTAGPPRPTNTPPPPTESPPTESSPTATPADPVVRGEALFAAVINGAQSCASCHKLTADESTGPSLMGYGRVAGARVAGQSAEEYTREALLRPGAYVLPGWSNVMYTGYATRWSDEQISDMVAFLLAQ